MRYMAAFFFIICFSASAFADGSVTIKWGKDANVEQSDANQKNKNNGPPAHAPAHGYRAKYQYRYYPDRSVYYDTSRKIYFYLQGSNWEFGASLPASFRAGLGDFVNLEMDTGKPYLYHGQHVKKYPPGQVKQNKQKKWSKKSHKK
jgi:hypothetical protein